VEDAAQRGAAGLEVPMEARGREPELQRAASVPDRRPEVPGREPVPTPVEPRGRTAKDERAARRSRAREARRESKERAFLDRAAALVAKAEAKAARDRANAEHDDGTRRAGPTGTHEGSRWWSGRPVRTALVGLVIATAAAVPWVAPQIPDALSGLLPGHDGAPAKVTDPTVSPPTDAFVGPVGVSQDAGPYDGVRLQAAGPPREVVVPRLHVDSTVLPISGQSGALLPPSDPQVLGWWQEGRPAGAQYGSAVVTGHTVHTGGGALDHLGELVVGDSVRVRTDQGWIRYVVKRTRVYSTEELARDADQIFRLGGTGRLVLITCDDWNGSFYESNAVVFATPVDDQPN
jgi:LPXTG-site transpeptidase (sortase) family protein